MSVFRLRWLIALAFVKVFWGSASCFPDAVPLRSRQNITATGLPVGIYSQDWDSAELLTRVVLILISEVMGYNVVISGHGPSSRASLIDFVGCIETDRGVECPSGPYPSHHPHHVLLEVWEPAWIDTANAIELKNAELTVEMVDVGYDGEDGPYVPLIPLQKAQDELGLHLEYYSEFDARWNAPWAYFAQYQSIDLIRLKECSLSVMGQRAMMAPVIRWTPDQGGFDSTGRAVCPDGRWWLSPACRQNSSRCVPYLTGGDGWRIQDAMQRAIEYHLPLALGVAENWGNFTSIPLEYDVLVYSWEPAMHLLSKNLKPIIFPTADPVVQQLRDFRTATSSIRLKNVINGDLGVLLPKVRAFLQNMRLSMHDMRSLMRFMDTNGDYSASACMWLSNVTSWKTWIPDDRQCSRGQGMISREGGFVDDPTLAVSCAPCPSGRFSKKLENRITRVCTPCSSGTVQPMWGMDSCNLCAEGYSGHAAGLSECERCGKGRYSNSTGGEECADCPVGKTTDGTGLTSVSDCGCPRGTYLDSNRWSCVVCGHGMTCNDFDTFPMAAQGYQLWECGHDFCVFKCHGDVLRCPGGGLYKCATGRTGVACAECEAGKHQGSQGTCQDCSNGELSLILIGPLFLCALSGALYYKNVGAVRSSPAAISILFCAISAHALSVLQTLAALSVMNVGWSKPHTALLQSFSVLAFDIEWVPLSCVRDLSVSNRYVMRCMVAPCCIGFLFLIHLVYLVYSIRSKVVPDELYHGGSARHHKRHLILHVSICDFVMSFLFSIVSTFLSPLRCRVNPNELWTMVEYESQTCWQSQEHRELIILGSSLVLLPVGFLAYIAWVLHRLGSRLVGGDVDYLRAHDFLFARIRPQRLWFAFIVVLRNLGLAIVLVLPKEQWQAFTMEFVIVLYSLVVFKMEPWRFWFLNVLDTFHGFGFLVIFACVFTRVPADDSIEKVAVAAAGSLGLTLVFLFMWKFIGHLMYRKPTFRFYLCHHKQSAGAMARLLFMHFCHNNSHGSHAVFLSADHLARLDVHLWWLQNHTRTFLALLTTRMFHDPWCLSEIATAHQHNVRTRLLYLPSFVCPDMAMIDAVIASDYDSILTRHGIRIREVTKSVSHLLRVFATGFGKSLSVKGLEMSLDFVAPRQSMSMWSFDSSTPTSVVPAPSFGRVVSSRTHVHLDGVVGVLLHDGMVEESFVSAILLKHFLRMCLLVERTSMRLTLLDFKSGLPVEILSDDELVLLACFTHGCFRSNEFIFGLIMCSVLPRVVATLPIVIPEDFHYPTEETYNNLVDDIALFCEHGGLPSSLLPGTLVCVKDFTKSILNKIASPFAVKNDQAMLRMQTKAIWRRIATALAPKDAVGASDAKQELFEWASTLGYKTLQGTPVERQHLNLATLDSSENGCEGEENGFNALF